MVPVREWTPPRRLIAGPGGVRSGVATVAIVWPCPLSVDEYVAAGRGVALLINTRRSMSTDRCRPCANSPAANTADVAPFPGVIRISATPANWFPGPTHRSRPPAQERGPVEAAFDKMRGAPDRGRSGGAFGTRPGNEALVIDIDSTIRERLADVLGSSTANCALGWACRTSSPRARR